MNQLVVQLSEKIRTEATVWRIIAVIQVVIGLLTIVFNLFAGSFGEVLYGSLIILIAVRNYKLSADDLKFVQIISVNPIGIVSKYESIIPLIINLAYNIFVGGVIGAVACVFGFMTRSFVVKNKEGFLALENGVNGTNNPFNATQFNYNNH